MRLRTALAALLAPLLLWLALPVLSPGSPQSEQAEIQRKIDAKRSRIAASRSTDRQLSSSIATYSRRISTLQGDIDVLQRRQAVIQADLDDKRGELVRLQGQLRDERARLTRLRARLAESRRALSDRLVSLYKADNPDLVTVVLNSDGFAQLLERTEFLERISKQDRRIVTTVSRAKADAVRTERRLERLEGRQRKVTTIVLRRRNEVRAIKGQLVARRSGYQDARSRRKEALGDVRNSRARLEGDLRTLEAASNRITAQLAKAAAAAQPNARAAGPVKRGSGALIYPVNGPVVSPFGQRWGRLHAGIDIAAPAGTPIRAADSGKVVLQQGVGASGGYGNFVCIAHGSGLQTCYAHLSRFGTSQGSSVSKGQVIGDVGCTGHCFGDHLHFETRVGGGPRDPMGYL